MKIKRFVKLTSLLLLTISLSSLNAMNRGPEEHDVNGILCDDVFKIIISDLSKSGNLNDLYSLCRVSKQLNRVSKKYWKHISCPPRTTNEQLEAIITVNYPNLQSIDLGEYPEVTNTGIMVIANNCPNLRSIRLGDNFKATAKGIRALADKCRYLQFIDLDGNYELNSEWSDEAIVSNLAAIEANYPNLRFINHHCNLYAYPVCQSIGAIGSKLWDF